MAHAFLDECAEWLCLSKEKIVFPEGTVAASSCSESSMSEDDYDGDVLNEDEVCSQMQKLSIRADQTCENLSKVLASVRNSTASFSAGPRMDPRTARIRAEASAEEARALVSVLSSLQTALLKVFVVSRDRSVPLSEVPASEPSQILCNIGIVRKDLMLKRISPRSFVVLSQILASFGALRSDLCALLAQKAWLQADLELKRAGPGWDRERARLHRLQEEVPLAEQEKGPASLEKSQSTPVKRKMLVIGGNGPGQIRPIAGATSPAPVAPSPLKGDQSSAQKKTVENSTLSLSQAIAVIAQEAQVSIDVAWRMYLNNHTKTSQELSSKIIHHGEGDKIAVEEGAAMVEAASKGESSNAIDSATTPRTSKTRPRLTPSGSIKKHESPAKMGSGGTPNRAFSRPHSKSMYSTPMHHHHRLSFSTPIKENSEHIDLKTPRSAYDFSLTPTNANSTPFSVLGGSNALNSEAKSAWFSRQIELMGELDKLIAKKSTLTKNKAEV